MKKLRVQTQILGAVTSTLILMGCGTVLYDEETAVDWREGMVYEKGTTNLFTGRVVTHDCLDPERVLFLHTFRKGRHHGLQREYWENGNIRMAARYKDGQPCGRWTHWHENGKREGIVNYRDGECHGPSQWWDEDGNITAETYFRDGKEHGTCIEYHANGRKAIETTWRNGQLNGPFCVWYGNGQKMEEGHFSNWVPVGTSTRWDTNGHATCVTVQTNTVPVIGEQSPRTYSSGAADVPTGNAQE